MKIKCHMGLKSEKCHIWFKGPLYLNGYIFWISTMQYYHIFAESTKEKFNLIPFWGICASFCEIDLFTNAELMPSMRLQCRDKSSNFLAKSSNLGKNLYFIIFLTYLCSEVDTTLWLQMIELKKRNTVKTVYNDHPTKG